MGLTRAQIIQVHDAVDPDNEESYTEAGNLLMELHKWKGEKLDAARGSSALKTQFEAYLLSQRWIDAALLAWGHRQFNPEPRSVRLIFKAIIEHPKVLAMGGTAQGKTYSASVLYLLRWCADPWNTLCKLISTSGGHSKSNIYSQFVRLHESSVVQLPGFIRESYIGMSTNEQVSAITRIAIDDGEAGAAALRGFHPVPRQTPHPIWGTHTFSEAILDEAEGIVGTVWKGVDNLAGTENTAVYAATNPWDIASEFAMRAEPLDGGWASFNRDADTEWEGKERWKVIRLDPSKSENIVQRKLIFPGNMSYENWLDYESKGVGSPDRDCFGHGCYPSEAVEYQIFSPNITNRMQGYYNFITPATSWASFDGAYAEGGDRPVLTTGKYGMADWWTDKSGNEHTLDFPRWCIWAEQQFSIPKVYHEGKPNDILMGDRIIEICTRLHIAPEYFVMDMTGNGHGIFSYLCLQYGGVMGIEWASASTEMKILEEHKKKANEQFPDIISEMLFASRDWAEYDALKVSPQIQSRRLFQQLANRKYKYVTKAMRKAESKADYKKRPPKESPDELDSLIMGPQLIRSRSEGRPAMVEQKTEKQKKSLWDDVGPQPEKAESLYSWVKV